MLKDAGRHKKIKLDWKCPFCNKRYNESNLMELGYIETVCNIKNVYCPNCGKDSVIK